MEYTSTNYDLTHNRYICSNPRCQRLGDYISKEAEKQEWLCRACGRANEGHEPHKLGKNVWYSDGTRLTTRGAI